MHSFSSCALKIQSNRAKDVKEPQRSREALLSLKRACAFDYLVLASQWETSPFSHLYWWCHRWCPVPILVWEQFDTTEGIPRVLWTGQKIMRTAEIKSPSSLKHWTHSEPLLWFRIWHQGCFLVFFTRMSQWDTFMEGITAMLLSFLLH